MSPWKQRKRYAKGSYMRLKSVDLLRAFVVTKEDIEAYKAGKPIEQKISQRHLAEKVNVHPSFINHLTSGRKKSCEPHTAESIAEALGVPVNVIFYPKNQLSGGKVTNVSRR
ncbi:helix-turn-helix transcriptional regulator [Glutamicibacter sp. M10]|uniref:helix-turn-helix transcriptional regulator n=1 Tax=Glutamicibacter sp. M10 TaxID=3023076 RepID=UPI0021CA9D4B|nr:helix-turn-helix transcriptional regulator [Glutamicibacter sp. M10]UXN30974.1 helix-turn-helix transcriptional regulator [Glutamicibacter sp. M10]